MAATTTFNQTDSPEFAELIKLRKKWKWEITWLLCAAALLLIIAFDPTEDSWPALVAALVGTALAAATYWTIGIRAEETRNPRLIAPYLVMLIIAAGISQGGGLFSGFLTIMVVSEIVVLVKTRWIAVAAVIALTLVTAVTMLHAVNWDLSSLRAAQNTIEVGGIGFTTLTFSIVFYFLIVAFGLVTARDALVQERNARLVGELRIAQQFIADQEHTAGISAERERMAGEIHDTLAQGFTSIIMQAQVAMAALDRDNAELARTRLDTIATTARANLAEARSLVAAHAPAPLQGASLVDALHRLCDQWSSETGTRTVVTTDVGPLIASQEVVLLRVAQEALSNVSRHAQATSVAIILRGGGGAETTLDVGDDGVGIPAQAAPGYGLRGMRERVEAAGGTFDVAPGPHGGTIIHAALPGTEPG